MFKWWVLLTLYLTQGLPHGFFSQALPTLLRQQGMSLEAIGLMSLVSLPWVLKFLWAPLLDHYQPLKRLTGGRIDGHIRKTWIVFANAVAAIVLIFIASIPLNFWISQAAVGLACALLVLTVFVVTQDIATDALAVENIAPAQRGLGNSVQVAGYRLGMIIGGGLLLAIFAQLGWAGTLWALAGLMILGLIPLWFWQPARVKVDKEPVFNHWLGFLRLPGASAWLLLLLTYKVGDAFGTVMIRPHLVDLGVTLPEFAELLGVWGTIAGLVGALLGGLLLKLLSRMQALLLFVCLEGIAIGLYSLLTSLDWTLIYSLIIAEHVTGGMATVALFTVMMDRCRESSAGSDYALQSCLVVLSTLIASSLAGFFAANFGYTMHYYFAVFLCVMGLLAMLVNKKNINAYHS
ncbi:Putative transporter (Major facilitator superfamily protein, MFS) [Oleispira antarctica RB-8]|uniref:Putative transporter (Major facilitator superfamily protein, MFS) n=1 Tax=Oleispira antarctica RB-8 TaxID=698738 RepID=R4YND9_OLEAN|nr:Putative transporter (Major facilitator superfamily protein, MFS) [Oleispira antarctica RB-8]